jgi:hypothetical protein
VRPRSARRRDGVSRRVPVAARPGSAVSTEIGGRAYRSIFAPSSRRERADNFEAYWRYIRDRDGEILETERDLEAKRQRLACFRQRPVRSRRPLSEPRRFYDNALVMRDDPQTLDRRTLLLTFLYKFAWHEWVGITAAWDTLPGNTELDSTIARISRYHLCEEFCHMRLFQEMFRTFQLDGVGWAPPRKWMGRLYRLFARLPSTVLAPPAFVTELMGLTVYRHLDHVLDDILADEPEARDRMKELLLDVMIDELGHVGQRRNFLGPGGVRCARRIVGPMYRAFFRGLPESHLLFDVDGMIEDGKTFDYSTIPANVIRQSWVPSYCRS